MRQGAVGADAALALHAYRAAADRIEAPRDRAAVGEVRGESHAVGVAGQEALVPDDVHGLVEAHRGAAAKRQGARFADAGEDRLGLVGVDPLGRLAGEAEDHRAVSGVAAAGERERAVEVTGHPPGRNFVLNQHAGEAVRGAHRPHGVRARRADADGEQVDDADLLAL